MMKRANARSSESPKAQTDGRTESVAQTPLAERARAAPERARARRSPRRGDRRRSSLRVCSHMSDSDWNGILNGIFNGILNGIFNGM